MTGCATCGTKKPLALETSQISEKFPYLQEKKRVIREFETFCGRPRPRLSLCEPISCKRILKY